MRAGSERLCVLQAKFGAWLAWSQPFIYDLVRGVGRSVDNVVVCNRTENLERFPVPQLVRLPVRYVTEPRLALLAAAHLERRFRPDVIHAHFGWSGLRMLLLRQYLRIPMVVTFGGRDLGVQMPMPEFKTLYRALLEASEQIICVSEELRATLVAEGVDPERVAVIRRGTDLARFAFEDRSGRDPAAGVRALMVGRLIEKKGHRYALEALAALAREGTDLRLTVVGEGEEIQGLLRLARALGIRDRVDFAGTTDHAGVRARMAEADLLLHGSVTGRDGDKEGIPNVVVEAQATGLPVVATRHGGIAEVVRDGETGFLVAERDPAALAAAAGRLARDRTLRLAMGAAAGTFARAELDLEKQIARHVAIYEKLAAEHSPESERMRAHFVPADFGALVDRTFRVQSELSLSELSERLVRGRSFDASFAAGEPRPGLVSRAYNLKRFVPMTVKFPAKLLLGRVLIGLIELRRRFSATEAPEEVDRRVADYFRAGGRLEVEGDDWGVVERLLHWHPDSDAEAAEPE
jgi:glycosyltransferase involved in cell wall biosynthesis